MRLRRYPEYRDSGVEWLGQIPSDWAVTPLKYAVDPSRPITYGIVQCGPDVPEGIPYVRPVDMADENGISMANLQRTSRQIEAAYARSRLLPRDLVVSIGPSSGKVMVVPPELGGANLTQGTARISPRDDVDGRFLFWALRSRPTKQAWDSHSSGATFSALTLETLATVAVSLPPLIDQRAIATFLDRETAKIDALVAKKERLIDLLQEKRTALISRVVTKGLDPSVPMKDSGVDWLGPIPTQWTVTPAMRLTALGRPIMYGIVLPGPNVQDGVPIVKGGDVAPGGLRRDSLDRTTFEIEAGYIRSRLRGGDIVYAIRGSIGAAEIVPDELEGANLTQDAARISPASGFNALWLLFALRSRPVFAQLEGRATGATIRGINIRDLKRACIPVAPRIEQDAIAAFLDCETAKIDTLIAKVREAMERLREYRTALISAAVTGKIDVRGEAVDPAPLPE